MDSSVAITLEAAVCLGAMPIYEFGTDEQRATWLPELCSGARLAAFGLTEPGGGSDIRGGMRTVARLDGKPFPTTRGLAGGWIKGRLRRGTPTEAVYCAELVAATYTAMDLLPRDRPANWYDPGRFWSGDELPLLQGASLGPEIAVDVPAA